MSRHTDAPRPDEDTEPDVYVTACLRSAATLHASVHCADALHQLTVLLDDPHLSRHPDTTAAVLEQYLARHAACGRLTLALAHLIRHTPPWHRPPGVDRRRLADLTRTTALAHRGVCRMPPPCRTLPVELPDLPSTTNRHQLWNTLLGVPSVPTTRPHPRPGRHRTGHHVSAAPTIPTAVSPPTYSTTRSAP